MPTNGTHSLRRAHGTSDSEYDGDLRRQTMKQRRAASLRGLAARTKTDDCGME